MSQRICFIGAGNMAASLIGGMIANGKPADSITACDSSPQAMQRLQQQYGINTNDDNLSGSETADIIVLAVKPQVMQAVCEPLARLSADDNRLFISIAAGVPSSAIDQWLGGDRPVVRCMPNTPALLQLGATGLFANDRVSDAQKQSASEILDAVGVSIWVDIESQLDAVTAISGSGPAYFFYFIELLQAAGVKLGLDESVAATLARQTALGAASMSIGQDVAQLRANVTSKKGTTEQAILSFQHNNLERLVNEATAAARDRAVELANEMAGNSADEKK